jgi:hypothetical protein
MYFGAIGKDATITGLTDAGLAVEQAHVVQEDEDGTAVQFLWVLGLKPAYDQQADVLEEGSKRRERRGRR